ncbi:hypothetical protein Q7M_1075 (plasmid) [Borrelia crocidurae str. Achema]|uniref:Lipoprotein n=2 Tax=Borrelia crocidurae TaxID=29520 RepID=I0FE77_BORCA|nr:hypothetical protein Q7M_1075 [Borrelia crocidurae str. Achema]
MKRMALMFSMCVMSLIFVILACDPMVFIKEMESRDRAYAILRDTVLTYKKRVISLFDDFQKLGYEFNIPFEKFIPVFSLPDSRNNVYAALEYDVASLERLVKICEKFDITSDMTDEDTKLIYDLLYLLKEIAEPIDEIINLHLRDEYLSRISTTRSASSISVITVALRDSITKERELVFKIKERILAIDPAGIKQVIVIQIRDILDDGNINANIRFIKEMARRISRAVR